MVVLLARGDRRKFRYNYDFVTECFGSRRADDEERV